MAPSSARATEPTRAGVLRRLASGAFVSGQALAAELGCSRAAVWKAVRFLRAAGLEVQAVRGRGYRLAAPLELLDAGRVAALLRGRLGERAPAVEVLQEVDSTNSHLLRRAAAGGLPPTLCLAERQSAGRGRRGRRWLAAPGSLLLSLAWPLGGAVGPGLALAAGVAAARALEEAGVAQLGLKWPNDLLWRGRKLGGILIELAGELGGATAVVGLGINLRPPPAGVDQPVAHLEAALGRLPSRNALAAALAAALVETLETVGRQGLAAVLPAWRRLDHLAGRSVWVEEGRSRWCGRACGVGDDGALLVRHEGGLRRLYAGEVSVRGEPGP